MSTTTHNQTAQTAAEAFERYTAALEAGALVQGSWHGRGDDGRELACALGSLGPDVHGPSDCPARVMPLWLARMVPRLFDGQSFEDSKSWGQRFFAELKRLDGAVPFSVVHDWHANVVAPLSLEWRALKGVSPDAALAVQNLHRRALQGDVAPRTEWFEALRPYFYEAYRANAYANAYADAYANADAYAYAYANADAYADADAYANADAYADAYACADAYAYAYAYANAYAKRARRQEALKRMADGLVECLSRVQG